MWRSEWSALSRRISGLLEAAKFHISCRAPGSLSADPHGLAGKFLLPSTSDIFEHLKQFRERHAGTLPPPAIRVLNSFFIDPTNSALFSGSADNNNVRLQFCVTALVALEAEISYHLTDFRARAKRLSERAFTHLQRSIVADPEYAKRWQNAFNKGRETDCEKLGAAHLLWHGIWAFKANTEGGRTDLIMGDVITDPSRIEDVAEALVLTEWKKVKKASELLKARDAAHKQAKLYAGGSLAGLELDTYRYLVLVTERALEMPNDIDDELGVTYHPINIAVDPLTPSHAARQRG